MRREGDGSVGDWWERCFGRLKDEDMCMLLTIVWAVWGARCKVLMEHARGKPTDILAYALKTSKEALEVSPVHSVASGTVQSSHPSAWTKPATHRVKVNVDAGCLGSLGCGLRVVCRDDRDEVMVTF